MLDKRMGNQNIAREKSKMSVPTSVIAQKQADRGAAMVNVATAGPRAALSVAKTILPQPKLAMAVKSGADKIVGRLGADRAAQGATLATMQNASSRNAQAKLYPEGKTVMEHTPKLDPKGNLPGFGPLLATNPDQPAAPQRDGIASKNLDQATQQSFQRATAATRLAGPAAAPVADRPASGPGQHSTAVFSQQPGNNSQVLRHPDQTNSNQQPRLAAPRNQMNGTMQVGNMDVTFDENTPQAARQAFMTDPVKPVAQIAQYDRRVQAQADQQEAQARAKAEGPPELLTPENSTMGWKSRLAANDQLMANWRQQQQDKTQLTAAREGHANQLDNTRLSGTIAGANQLANTGLATQGRLQEIDRTGAIDTQQIDQQGNIAAQAETRKFAADAVLKGADPAAVQKGIMNTQGGATPDVTGINVPQASEAESYTYHAPQLDSSSQPIRGTGGFAAKKQPRLIPLEAAAPMQPEAQEIPEAQPGGVVATPEQALGNDPARVQQFSSHMQKLKALQTPEEAMSYLDSLMQPDQYGVVDSAMYSLLMREISGGR